MSKDDSGFTLLELMVVVLIIAILLAIAVPTFLGARTRANDRRAQSNVRNAHTNELIFFSDNTQQFTDDIGRLRDLDPSLDWTDQLTEIGDGSRTVYVYLDVVSGQQAVIVGAQSEPGRCFWLRAVANTDQPRFARNDCSIEPAAGEFLPSWSA